MKTAEEMAVYLIAEFKDKAELVAKIGRDYSDAAGCPFWDAVKFRITQQRLLKIQQEINKKPDLPPAAYRYEY